MAAVPQRSFALQALFLLCVAGSLTGAIPVIPALASDGSSADSTITLDVQNEPLRSVLGKIQKMTNWEIKVPEKLADKPITRRLNQVLMDEGLRFILRDAGVENLLLIHDEGKRIITVFDMGSPGPPRQSVNRPPAQSEVRPPVQPDIRPPVRPPMDRSDPMLNRPPREPSSGPLRGGSRSKNRRQPDED